VRFAELATICVLSVGLAPAAAEADDAAIGARLAEQLAAELKTLESASTVVGEKLDAIEALRIRRVRAAYRILRGSLPSDASPGDRMASARRRAAARLLLQRDRDERALLAGEAVHLASAKSTITQASEHLPTVSLPESLTAPARGSIARTFGTILHERSGATLSRRGLDFDVEPSAPVVAPADGVVRYAGPMRGLDHGVVIDHGDYLTVVAKLGELSIPVGTRVTRGDRFGRAARQRVYFEVRAKVGPGGLPIDPQPLLAK
jgi:murein hydrolase activator